MLKASGAEERRGSQRQKRILRSEGGQKSRLASSGETTEVAQAWEDLCGHPRSQVKASSQQPQDEGVLVGPFVGGGAGKDAQP